MYHNAHVSHCTSRDDIFAEYNFAIMPKIVISTRVAFSPFFELEILAKISSLKVVNYFKPAWKKYTKIGLHSPVKLNYGILIRTMQKADTSISLESQKWDSPRRGILLFSCTWYETNISYYFCTETECIINITGIFCSLLQNHP